MKLYEISDAIRAALDHIELDEETGEILSADALHAVEAEAAEKIEATALYLRELDAEAKAAKEEADRMLDRVKSMQKRSDYLKAMLLDALHATGKVKTGRVTVSIRTTQAVQINQEQAIPEAFTTVKTTVSPNKIAIKQALLDGVEVPGCHLEARESVSDPKYKDLANAFDEYEAYKAEKKALPTVKRSMVEDIAFGMAEQGAKA